eukprot:6202050-Pleurochrysis_carterae.AAC.1
MLETTRDMELRGAGAVQTHMKGREQERAWYVRRARALRTACEEDARGQLARLGEGGVVSAAEQRQAHCDIQTWTAPNQSSDGRSEGVARGEIGVEACGVAAWRARRRTPCPTCSARRSRARAGRPPSQSAAAHRDSGAVRCTPRRQRAE